MQCLAHGVTPARRVGDARQAVQQVRRQYHHCAAAVRRGQRPSRAMGEFDRIGVAARHERVDDDGAIVRPGETPSREARRNDLGHTVAAEKGRHRLRQFIEIAGA